MRVFSVAASLSAETVLEQNPQATILGVAINLGTGPAGALYAVNDLAVSGDVDVGGRLHLNEQSTNGDGSSGCQRVGTIMTCWGTSTLNANDNHEVHG